MATGIISVHFLSNLPDGRDNIGPVVDIVVVVVAVVVVIPLAVVALDVGVSGGPVGG